MIPPDQIEGAPHPRETSMLYGQSEAEEDFLRSFSSGKLHHAWLLTGPRGVGKATLAWSIARFLLATPDIESDGLFGAPPPPESLQIDPNHPVARRILAGSDPGLKSITRTHNETTGRLRDVISVDDIRGLSGFFQLSAADGGRRVVIIDSADEMNAQAANALLKMLEEPPDRAVLLLISHRPSALLPTIRSRCRVLRLKALAADDMQMAMDQAGVEFAGNTAAALSELSGGSVGSAMRLSNLDGLKIYAELLSVIEALPQFDRARAIKLAEASAARGAEAKRDLLFDLVNILLARLAQTGAHGRPPSIEITPNEAATLMRLSNTPQTARRWAEVAQETSSRAQHGLAVNLDPAALVLDTLIKISQTQAR